MASASCPNCGSVLSKRPQRKTKCPDCGKYIIVRGGVLLGEEETQIHDWVERLKYLGLDREEYERHNAALCEQFGVRPKSHDTIWRFLNALVATTESWFDRSGAYREMARIVSMEGRDPSWFIAEAAKCSLLELKQSGTTKVTVHTCNDDIVCDACRALEGQVFDIDQALDELPVPNLCTGTECRCAYSPAQTNGFDESDETLLRQASHPKKADKQTPRSPGCFLLITIVGGVFAVVLAAVV